jgi:hypothetical protein
VEDPQFVFFIRYLPWKTFSKDLGFCNVDFSSRYDFALSFAGSDRKIAEALFNALREREVIVFYDKQEQERILGKNVEKYLMPIYQSEARFIVCLLGLDYPKRVWTKIESEAFKDRFEDGSVIPIWFDDVPEAIFDTSREYGGYEFRPSDSLDEQINEIANLLCEKLGTEVNP